MKKQRVQKGFTVIELIIVTVVIGILATIAVVSYSGTSDKAKKSSYDATAQQVRLKLNEHFTDNNYYPLDKAAVESYLTTINAGKSIRDEFAKTPSPYVYKAYTTTQNTIECSTPATNCKSFKITVAKSNWNGNSADKDIVVEP